MVFLILNFERNYDVSKSKRPCILLNKKINFNKNETELKMENPSFLERRTLCFSFSSHRNHKLKVKRWCIGAREKKRAFFVLFILSKRKFFKICVFISMYSVLNILPEYTYFYISKNITSYTFVACFQNRQNFQCILILHYF